MKPVLLIVDDDRAVLEALEFEIEPALGERCVVQTFDRPREALEAIPRWGREGRNVALAVVDQRMPELTGIEFLRELSRMRLPEIGRDEPGLTRPGAGARSVLLTAYGGQQAFEAAVHQGRADLYREKPWRGDELLRDLKSLLALGPRPAGGTSDEGELPGDRELPDPRMLLELLSRARSSTEGPHLDADELLELAYSRLSGERATEVRALLDSSRELRMLILGLRADLGQLGAPSVRARFNAADVRAAVAGFLKLRADRPR